MNKKAIGLAVVIFLLALGWGLRSQYSAEKIAELTSTTTPAEVQSSHTDTSGTKPVSTVKTYTNAAFHYSFSYPSSWVSAPEKSAVDLMNQIPSIVSVNEPQAASPHRFSVTINRNERTLKNEATKTESITVGGVAATAYIFPDGYGCTETGDCSFFLIPILHRGVWYELTAANNAKTIGYYKEILASFKFTQ